MSNELAVITNAQRALSEAKTIPEIKAARDAATGAKAWVKSRGLGIESENEASEYILRAERRIGLALIRMGESGERLTTKGPRPFQGNRFTGVVVASDTRPLNFEQIGIKPYEAGNWQRLARLPEDTFERMLGGARANRERLAKVNFYTAAKSLTKDATPEVPINKGFDMFRAGVYHMLGWRVDQDGVGGPTRNDLLMFPQEELLQIKEIVAALGKAWKEASEARTA